MYSLIATQEFEKQFKKLDKSVQVLIANWIHKHLENTDDPRIYGKPLTAKLKGYWRYRIGDYRLLVEIKDAELVIIEVDVAHRREVYKR